MLHWSISQAAVLAVIQYLTAKYHRPSDYVTKPITLSQGNKSTINHINSTTTSESGDVAGLLPNYSITVDNDDQILIGRF